MPTTHSAASRVLHESQVSPKTIDHLHAAYRQQLERTTSHAAGWHGISDIVTLEGLAGHYFWAENPAAPGRITFTFDPAHVGNQGSYHLEAPGRLEQGSFYCVPNNPAIGWAFISLVPTTGSVRPFIVSGMFTDEAWKISILMLNKTDAHGPVQPPFSALRVL